MDLLQDLGLPYILRERFSATIVPVDLTFKNVRLYGLLSESDAVSATQEQRHPSPNLNLNNKEHNKRFLLVVFEQYLLLGSSLPDIQVVARGFNF